MKRIICNGHLEEKVVEHKEFGVSLGKFKAKVCSKCNEIYFDSEIADKIQLKFKEIGLFGLAKNDNLFKF